jgi:hypothetical protein
MMADGALNAVLAVTFSGRASTELEWYDTGDGETAVPVYQYLLLNADELGAGLTFRGYGRLADDLADEDDVDSRLYYGYLQKNDLVDGLDLRFGRQFISTSAGASIMDGLYVDYDGLNGIKLSLFGGGDVAYYEGYNAKDLIAGIELRTTLFDELAVGLSYVQKWDHSELANELFGLDLDYDWNNKLHLYSETQFNYLANTVSYFLGGAKWHQSENWSLRSEYLYSLPVFSSTSIYSVFAVDEYQELFIEYERRLMPGLHVFVNYTHEMYDQNDDAGVVELGIEKIRTHRFSGYVIGTWREDPDGQDLVGLKLYAASHIGSALQFGAGLHLDVMELRLDEDQDETTNSRLWVDTTYTFTRKINLQAKLERIESDLWDDYYSGRVRLNIQF